MASSSIVNNYEYFRGRFVVGGFNQHGDDKVFSGRGCGGSWQEASKILYGGKRLCTIPESDITPTAITRLSDPCTAGRRYDGNSNGIRCIIGSV